MLVDLNDVDERVRNPLLAIRAIEQTLQTWVHFEFPVNHRTHRSSIAHHSTCGIGDEKGDNARNGLASPSLALERAVGRDGGTRVRSTGKANRPFALPGRYVILIVNDAVSIVVNAVLVVAVAKIVDAVEAKRVENIPFQAE